jgi:uncharacterized membrane protein required for colicin V production
MIVGHPHFLDISIGLFVFYYSAKGFQKGLLQQMASIVPWWGAIILGVLLAPLLVNPLRPYVTSSLLPYTASVLGTALVFGLLTFGVQALNHLLQKTPLAWLSPLLGALLGALYAALWVGVFIIACSFQPLAAQSWVKRSLIVSKSLGFMTKIAYFEIWKSKAIWMPSWLKLGRYW